MGEMNAQLILTEIQAAKQGVTEAEEGLEALLRTLQSAARAEKTTISAALQTAFDKLRSSRLHLVKLEELARGGQED